MSQTQPASRRQIARWLLTVTRPVLSPLWGSTLARILDQVCALALFILPVHAVFTLAQNPGGSGTYLWKLGGIMVALSVAKALLRYLEQFLGHYVAFKALELLRADAFERLYPQAPAIMYASHSGQLLSRLTRDIDHIEVFFAHTIAPTITAVLIPLLIVIVSAVMNPLVITALVVAILVVAALVVPMLGNKRSYEITGKMLRTRAHATTFLTDSINGAREVAGYGREAAREQELQAITARMLPLMTRAGAWEGIRKALSLCLRFGAPVLLLAVGSGYVLTGQMPLENLLVLTFAVLRAWGVIDDVSALSVELNAALASASRVFALRSRTLELEDGEDELPTGPLDLRFDDVTFAYPQARNEAATIREVSLRANAGQWTAIIGATGSGKSTLARLALRYFDPQAGQIRLGGVDVRDVPVDDLRGTVALVTSDIRLFNHSIAYNLRLANPHASDEELWQALSDACIADEVRALPNGLETSVGERGQALSGGQRQRVSLAQALLRNSKVLFLDEFTAHLDPALAGRVRRKLRERHPGVTIVEITHQLDHLAHVDQVVVLDRGRVVAQGSPQAVVKNLEEQVGDSAFAVQALASKIRF
ncbi:ABC transporter ATP-binding protein [Gleimia hominis]|uniref:ABC transporter ATP-binding protein n=1 Tax=Gleimia hominis TaxID=595468 RepID=A0ABU3IFG1_9ACTO|nr:ABC transporter ATP-binding protein [Gleimia hominis]MDT3767975.1 ABC transporter ATP-binding protein [Gleimia hominis]